MCQYVSVLRQYSAAGANGEWRRSGVYSTHSITPPYLDPFGYLLSGVKGTSTIFICSHMLSDTEYIQKCL